MADTDTEACLIYTTWPADPEGLKTTQAALSSLLNERLIACANQMAPSTSIYEWQGEVCRDQECIVILKTTRALVKVVFDRYCALHPYDEPCFLVLNIDQKASAKSFIHWINTQTVTRQ